MMTVEGVARLVDTEGRIQRGAIPPAAPAIPGPVEVLPAAGSIQTTPTEPSATEISPSKSVGREKYEKRKYVYMGWGAVGIATLSVVAYGIRAWLTRKKFN